MNNFCSILDGLLAGKLRAVFLECHCLQSEVDAVLKWKFTYRMIYPYAEKYALHVTRTNQLFSQT